MAILKRFLIWLVESSSEAILTGALLLIIAHVGFRGESRGTDRVVHDVLVASVLVTMMFFSTGYLLTTIIARLFLPERKLLYPCIAFALYVIHFEILNVAAGGVFEPRERWVIRVVGACIAFMCTLGGNQILSKWKPSLPLVEPA